MIKIKNSINAYGAVAKTFHWVMALAILGMLVLGFYMEGLKLSPRKFEIYGIHKAIGASILILAVLRLSWRFLNIVPELPATMPRWQRLGAHGSHVALYLAMIVMPLTGWLLSSSVGFPVSVFGLFTLPNLIAPDNTLRPIFQKAHEIIAFIIIGLVSLHALAALKHHFVDKDNILRRMLPVLLVLFFAQQAQAQDTGARNWYVVGDKSHVEFTATENNAPVKGHFYPFKMSILFSPDFLTQSSVQAQFDMASLHMDYAQAEEAVKSPDWLDIKKFPLATFQSVRITHLAGKNYTAEGNLIIRDVTLPLILHFSLEEYSDTLAHIKGEATLSRNAFGVGQGEWKGTDVVKDEVGVTFDIVAQNIPWTPPLKQ